MTMGSSIWLPAEADSLNDWHVGASWGARAEDPPRIAQRIMETLEAVQALGGPFRGDWTVSKGLMTVPTPAPVDLPGWTREVESTVTIDDAGQAFPIHGYSPSAANSSNNGRRVALKIHAGDELGMNERPVNDARLDWIVRGEHAAALRGSLAPQARHLIEALTTIWHPDQCSLVHHEVTRAREKLVPFSWPRLGTITWWSDAIAAIPDEVPGAVVERFGEGTFLIIGTPDHPETSTAQVMAVFEFLLLHDHLHPIPADQAREPHVPCSAPATGDLRPCRADTPPHTVKGQGAPVTRRP